MARRRKTTTGTPMMQQFQTPLPPQPPQPVAPAVPVQPAFPVQPIAPVAAESLPSQQPPSKIGRWVLIGIGAFVALILVRPLRCCGRVGGRTAASGTVSGNVQVT